MSIRNKLKEADIDQPADSIDMSPLIDVVFILLIFFIVTAVFTEDPGVEINRPSALSASSLEQGSTIIAISPDNSIHYAGQEITIDEISYVVKKNQKNPVIIQADEESSSKILIAVLDAANMAGAKSVNVATKYE